MIQEYKVKKIEGKITFSASNINNYLYNPKLFWDRVFERELFLPTTSLVLGTIIHYCANQYITKGEVDTKEIESYLSKHSGIDIEHISKVYKDMGNELFTYLDRFIPIATNIRSEYDLSTNVSKYGVLTGTCDLIIGDTLIDFKTTSKLSETTVLPMNYIKQLQAYYYLCQKNDIDIKYAKIVYISVPRMGEISEKTGKPLKDYPCKIYELGVENEWLDMERIDSLMNHIGKQIDFITENPEQKDLITREGVMI